MKVRKQKTAVKRRSESTSLVPVEFATAGQGRLASAQLNALIHDAGNAVDIDIADPYEIAYLRGGEKEVLKLVLFDLVERGYLEVRETRGVIWTIRRLAPAVHQPPLERLSEDERELMGCFLEPRTAAEIFQLPLPSGLSTACTEYRTRLQQSGLLSQSEPAALKALRGTSGLIAFAAAVILMLVLSPLLAFLAAVGISILIYRWLGQGRLTAKGRQRLKDIEARHAHLKDRARAARLDVHDPALPLLVGVFGTSALADSVHDAFAQAVSDASSDGDGADGDGSGGCGCGGCGCG